MPQPSSRRLVTEGRLASLLQSLGYSTGGGGGGGGNIVILEPGVSIPNPPVSGTVYLRKLSVGTGGGGTGPTPDTVAPSVPTGLVASAIAATGFRLTWGASTDNVGVQAYQVRLNNGLGIDVASGVTYAFTGLTVSTAYQAQVRARDFAGNWSAWSTALPVTTTAAGGSSGAASVWGTTPYEAVAGGTDGPAKLAMGFYTTLSGGMDVIGARLYLPEGMLSGFYSNSVAFGYVVRSHTAMTSLPASVVTGAPTIATMQSPLVPGWNEVLFPAPVHVNPYSAGTDNAIWITMLYNTVPYYPYQANYPTASRESLIKPGVYLAESNFPRAGNSFTGIGASGTIYPLDILVAS